MKLAEQILSLFKGRVDRIAVGTPDGAFAPASRAPVVSDLERHLAGKQCFGFYLLDPEGRCRCACVDFDNKQTSPDPAWQQKAEQLYWALSNAGLSPLVEVSQSGCAAHVWLFFTAPTPAWIPRSFFKQLAAKENIAIREIYPRQDRHVGEKSLGNLVRFPLWSKGHFASPENEWQPMDPAEALLGVQRVAAEDLSLLAFELGMGELAPEEPAAVTSVPGAEGSEPSLLPSRVSRLVEREGSLIGKRWRGDMAGLSDASASACAMSIASELVRLYVPTPEIAAALRFWCQTPTAQRLSVTGKILEKGKREDWINRTIGKAYDFVTRRTEVGGSLDSTTFKDAAHAYIDKLSQGKERFFESGVRVLDDSIDGMGESEMWVIGGRPSHGKSLLAFQWLDHLARQGIAGLLISEEMPPIQVGKRRLSSITSVPYEQWGPETVGQLRQDVDGYYKERAPVHIVKQCVSCERACNIITQFAKIHNVTVAAVDYAQLLGGRGESRYEMVTEISKQLKQVAIQNNIRLIVCAQASRRCELRDDKMPTPSDLKESGQLEQDADGILFVQWPWRYNTEEDKTRYRIACAKRRNGPIRQAIIETHFDADRQLIGFTTNNPDGIAFSEDTGEVYE